MYDLVIRANRCIQAAFRHISVIDVFTIFSCTKTALFTYFYFYHFAGGHVEPLPANGQKTEYLEHCRGGCANAGQTRSSFAIGVTYPNCNNIFWGDANSPAIAETKACACFPGDALGGTKTIPKHF